MKINYAIPVMASITVLLTACGGGGSTSSNISTNNSSFNLTGTVPGTLIEAFCENGSYYSVNSETNGTTKHPFKLRLPTNLSCRLVMTTNEGNITDKVVTPISFVTNNGVTAIAFSGKKDTDLGYIDLALSRSQMALDSNNDGVEDQPIKVALTNSSMVVNAKTNDPLDTDNDGIINVYEDDDNDGINNRDDDDDDNDGILDKNDSDNRNDRDHDGIDDQNDVDDDNNGIEDRNDNDNDNDDGRNDNDSDNEGNDDDNDDGGSNNGGNLNPTSITTPSEGRLLASQCAQCHGTDANSYNGFENLVGEGISGELSEMKRKNKIELMHLQAKGYSSAQIRAIDSYFNNLSSNRGAK